MAIEKALRELLETLQNPSDLSKHHAWCDQVEILWTITNQENGADGAAGESKRSDDEQTTDEESARNEQVRLLRQASTRLRFLLLRSLGVVPYEVEGFDQVEKSFEELVSGVILAFKAAREAESNTAVSSGDDGETLVINLPELEATLRVCKNFLRWYFQVYQTSYTRRSSSSTSTDPIPEWKSLPMLTLYLHLLQRFVLSSGGATNNNNPVMAQHVTQVLFYSSYNPIPGSDEGLQAAYNQLMEKNQLLSLLLQCLVHSTTTALTLSLVRNLHNILVTFPKGAEHAEQATATIEDSSSFEKSSSSDTSTTLAPWAQAAFVHRDGREPVTFQTALPLVALWALQSEPAFPGPVHDKRAELVVEIQRVCYVMRTGSNMQAQGPVADMILSLLRLDPTEPRCEDCRRASVSLLMDSSGDMAAYLLSQNALTPLLTIWEDLVTQVLEKQLVNEGAAAMLTPVLVVLHKFCRASKEVRQCTKQFLVPPDAEAEFQSKYRRELELHDKPRNMSPLDAPKGTLRWKMVQLLTWPQSHVKRFAGELLWALCDGSSQEFIARVGMGNAVPILGAKGIVQLPI